MNINQLTLQRVREAAKLLAPHQEMIIDKFYKDITDVNQLREIILEHSTIERLRKTMGIYLEQFLSGNVTEEYIKTRMIIGHVHYRVGLVAEHFLAAHHLLLQMMTCVIMEKLHHNPDQMISTVVAIQKLAAFDQQLIIEAYVEETTKSFLNGVSDTLDFMAQLDTSRPLLDAMDDMKKESESVSSAAEQVSVSIQEVSGHSIQVAEKTDEAVQAVSQGKQVVNEAKNNIQQVGKTYDTVVEQVDQLNREIVLTNDIVKIIQDITDQTNLLALNASIEAARAGEHGRGFAVVADEVRKLAEHTREQATQISTNMASLQRVSLEVTRHIEETGSLMQQSISAAQLADDELDTIVAAMHDIDEATSTIAAMSEQQTAAVEDIAQRNSRIIDLSHHSASAADQATQAMWELGQRLDQYRQLFFATNIYLSEKDMIEVMKTDHLLWRWRVYNMLLGVESIDHHVAGSFETCRLGTWYYKNVSAEIRALTAYKQLETPHIAVHTHAREAAELYEAGDMTGAYTSLNKLEQASKEVISLLSKLQASL